MCASRKTSIFLLRIRYSLMVICHYCKNNIEKSTKKEAEKWKKNVCSSISSFGHSNYSTWTSRLQTKENLCHYSFCDECLSGANCRHRRCLAFLRYKHVYRYIYLYVNMNTEHRTLNTEHWTRQACFPSSSLISVFSIYIVATRQIQIECRHWPHRIFSRFRFFPLTWYLRMKCCQREIGTISIHHKQINLLNSFVETSSAGIQRTENSILQSNLRFWIKATRFFRYFNFDFYTRLFSFVLFFGYFL